MLSVEPIHGDAKYYGGEANFETLENADGHWLGKGRPCSDWRNSRPGSL